LKRNKIRAGGFIAFLLGALVYTILFSMLNFQIQYVDAQAPMGTVLNVVPSSITKGEAGVQIPAGGLPFTVNITATNVTDLYAWQIRVYYFPSILNWTLATVPTDNIFKGKTTVEEIPPTQLDTIRRLENTSAVNFTSPKTSRWNWREHPTGSQFYNLTDWLDVDETGILSRSDIIWVKSGTSPTEYYRIQKIEISLSKVIITIELAYIEYMVSLIEDVPGVSGNGTLCQLTFAGIGPGVSVLNFSRPLGGLQADTILLNSDLEDIPFDAVDGVATVRGIALGKEPSTISLGVDKTTVKVGSNVTISGGISPTVPNVDVTISYKPPGEDWSLLKIARTDTQSQYSFIWTTTRVGTFEIKTSWAGDDLHEGDVSDLKTVTVTSEEDQQDFLGTYLPYIAAGGGAIVVVVVLLYFFKIRKR